MNDLGNIHLFLSQLWTEDSGCEACCNQSQCIHWYGFYPGGTFIKTFKKMKTWHKKELRLELSYLKAKTS